MENTNPEHIVQSFVESINRQDTNALFRLMSEDHVFVDSSGMAVKGRQKIKEAWAAYFLMFPDYSISAEWMTRSENKTGLFGSAQGTYSCHGKCSPENYWKIPAAWLAAVKDGLVREWRVYADVQPVLEIMERLEVIPE